MADSRIQAIQAYLAEHQLEPLLKDLMAAVLFYKPKNPVQFMINALNQVQQRKIAKMQFNTMDLFHELARTPGCDEPPPAPVPVAAAAKPAPVETASAVSISTSLAATVSPGSAIPISPSPLEPRSESPRDEVAARSSESPSALKNKPHITSEQLGIKYNMGRRGSVSAESLRPNTNEKVEKIVIPKSNEARMQIASAISNNLLFRNLERDQRQEVVDAMFERKVAAGEVVIRQGDEGDNFYVVSQGRFEVLINNRKVVEIGEGGAFGELALMYNTPRAATVKALVDSVLWAVDRVTFRRIIMNNTFRKRKMYESFVSTVPILQSLDNAELVKVADAFEPVSFEDEDVIIEEGDIGDSFYIIVEGEAKVTKKMMVKQSDGTEEEEEVELNHLKKGDYFGELALLTDKPRAATVTAVGDVQCVCLDTKAFIRLLGPVATILKRNAENYKKYSGIASLPPPTPLGDEVAEPFSATAETPSEKQSPAAAEAESEAREEVEEEEDDVEKIDTADADE